MLITREMETPHTDFSEVTRVVFIKVGSVVVLTTSKTTTSRMLAVLAHSSMTGRNVAAVFPCL